MDKNHICDLYDFNRWANARTLSAAEKLGHDDFTRDLGSSFRSIRDTLVHILGAEWLWLQRWNGVSPNALLPPADFATIAPLRARWSEVEAGQKSFVDGLTPESLERRVAYRSLKGEPVEQPLVGLLVHVVNHSTYHRGQVTTLLRQLGAAPEATDYVLYLRQRAR